MTSLNQTLHILRKDVRHLYPEITVSLSLVAMFAWIAPAAWPGYAMKMAYPGAQFGVPEMLNVLLHALVPLSWLVLISRAVHDESLVGDKQFWVTRPYTWYSLLGAKLLFIAGFVCVPLLIAQVFLVWYAGLPVVASLPGLLANMGVLALFFLLPFTLLAAITTSFGPMLLILLGGLLYLGLVGLVTTYLQAPRALPPHAVDVWLGVLAVVLCAILVYQYVQRKTGLSQILILATPIVLCALLLATPAGPFLGHAFPETTTVSATMDLDPTKQQPSPGAPLLVGQNVVVNLPLNVTGVPSGEFLDGKALRAELTSASGYHWVSSWLTFSNLLADGPTSIDFQIPASVAQRIGNETVKVRLSLAVERLAPGTPVNFQIDETDHGVPGGGVCSLLGEPGFAQPVCRYALRSPFTFAVTEVQNEMCPLDGSAPKGPSMPARAIIGRSQNPYAFDPVLAQGLRLSAVEDTPERPHLHTICPGAQVQMTGHAEAGGEQIVVEQTGLELAPYLRHRAIQRVRVGAGVPGAPQP